MLASKFIATD